VTFWKRTDYFTCNHTYKTSNRDLHLEKCPQCYVGDYQYSMVETDEKERPEPRPQPEYWPSAEGEGTGYWTVQGTPIQPPNVTSGTGATVSNVRFTGEYSPTQDVRSLYSDILTGSGSSYTEGLSEEHPFPDSTHNSEDCPVCRRLTRRAEELNHEQPL
jgi:hypothetical protein